MKINIITLSLALAFSATASANTEVESEVDHRLSVLEWRMQQAEQKNDPQSSVYSAVDGVDIAIGGDVEFNLDATSKNGTLTDEATRKKLVGGNGENWSLNGRIKLDIDAQQQNASGIYAGAHIQPLAKMEGAIGLDDAEFYIGQAGSWEAKVGRYEAYDMFNLNQDTFINYSGNTANDIYQDGYGYTYQMKEARGRSSSGGGILVSKEAGNWYFENNTLIEDGSKLFKEGVYHGNKLDNKKNVIYVRPVIAYISGYWTTALAAETNLIRNAYGYTNTKGQFIDQSKRNGLGGSLKYDNETVVWNLSVARLDASGEKDFSAGTNIWWNDAQVGYIYASNDIKAFNKGNHSNDPIFNAPGRYDIHTFHTSYRFADVADVKNLNIDVGAYASFIESSAIKDDSDKTAYGARARIKYEF